MKEFKALKRAVFVDRDGVINEDNGYVYRPEELMVVPRSAEAIKLLNENNFLVIAVSNQAGIAYGYFTEKDMRRFNEAIEQDLRQHGAHIDAFYFCPHHETKGVGEYRSACACRKPKPGLLLQAAKDFGIDLSRSFMVGDTWNDVTAGATAGCRTILVKTGQGREALLKIAGQPQCDFIADDLYGAAHYIFSF